MSAPCQFPWPSKFPPRKPVDVTDVLKAIERSTQAARRALQAIDRAIEAIEQLETAGGER